MAKVLLSGLETRIASQIEELTRADGHEVRRAKKNATLRHLVDADIIFAGGEAEHYLPLLRRVRAIDPSLCFVILAKFPRTADWLEAIDGGATDYWLTPLDQMRVRGYIAALPLRRLKTPAA